MLHIARAEDWRRAQARGRYESASGLIHCCLLRQLPMVAEAHFPDRQGFVVLDVDESAVEGDIDWVTFEHDLLRETFPHLRGAIPVGAVRHVTALAEALATARPE